MLKCQFAWISLVVMATVRKDIPYRLHVHEDGEGVFHQSTQSSIAPIPDPTNIRISNYSMPFRCEIKGGKVKIYDGQVKNGKKKTGKKKVGEHPVADYNNGWRALQDQPRLTGLEKYLALGKLWVSKYLRPR
jgi:hypothetical protein